MQKISLTVAALFFAVAAFANSVTCHQHKLPMMKTGQFQVEAGTGRLVYEYRCTGDGGHSVWLPG